MARVRYTETRRITGDRRLLILPLVLNRVVGPVLMFSLGWLLLPDLPTYRTGLIIVGLARCIAMVLIWNDLSGGDREAAAVLVAINSVFQIFAFAALGWFCLQVLPDPEESAGPSSRSELLASIIHPDVAGRRGGCAVDASGRRRTSGLATAAVALDPQCCSDPRWRRIDVRGVRIS